MRTGPDGYDALLGRVKPAKGERVAVIPYLEPDGGRRLRELADVVGETDGRVLFEGGIVTLVTDRKIIMARTSAGFRPTWEVFTLPFGHLSQVSGPVAHTAPTYSSQHQADAPTTCKRPTPTPPRDWSARSPKPSEPTAETGWVWKADRATVPLTSKVREVLRHEV